MVAALVRPSTWASRPPVPAASTNPVCHLSCTSCHRPVSGSWANTGLPRRVSSIPRTVTGGSGAASGTRTCSTNASCTLAQSTPQWVADSDTTRPCSAIAYPSSVRSRVVSLERARTAGSDSVNEARGQSRSLQRHRRLCQISRNTLCPVRDVTRPGAHQALEGHGQHPTAGARRRALVHGDQVHHPASERVRLDPVDRKAAQVEQTRGIRYRALLNMTNVRTLGQARGLT